MATSKEEITKDTRKSIKVDLATWRKLQATRIKLNLPTVNEVIKYLIKTSG